MNTKNLKFDTIKKLEKGQITINVEGKEVKLLKFMSNRSRYRVYKEEGEYYLLAECFKCRKVMVIYKLNKDTMEWEDIHDESEIHLKGESGTDNTCKECQGIVNKISNIELTTNKKNKKIDNENVVPLHISNIPIEFKKYIDMYCNIKDTTITDYIIGLIKKDKLENGLSEEDILTYFRRINQF